MTGTENSEMVVAEIDKFELTIQALEQMRSDFSELTIKGIEDKDGYKKVHDARMLVKSTRVKVEKTGADLRRKKRKEIEEYINKVNNTEKLILGIVSPIEAHLTTEEKAIDDEKDRLKKEAEERENVRIQARIDDLIKIGAGFDQVKYSFGDDLYMFAIDVKACSDDRFNDFFTKAKARVDEQARLKEEAEKARKAEEERQEKARADEDARLADENRKLIIKQRVMALRNALILPVDISSARVLEEIIEYKKRPLIEEVFGEFLDEALIAHRETLESLTNLYEHAAVREVHQAKIDADNRKIEEEKAKIEAEKKARQGEKEREEAEKKRKQEIKEAEERAAEQARKDAEAEIKKQAEEKSRLEAEIEEKAKEEEAQRPDREKLLKFASAIEMLPAPEIKTEVALAILSVTRTAMATTVRTLRRNVKTLGGE